MFGQHDAIAAGAEQHDLERWAPATRRRAVRRGRPRRSAAASSPAPAGDAIQVSIGPPGPGASTQRISGQARPSIHEEPIVVSGRSSPVRSTSAQLRRAGAERRRDRHAPAADARACGPATSPPRQPDRVARRAARSRGSTGNRQGCVRPRSVTRVTIPSPAGSQRRPDPSARACQPVRSPSAQSPTGRSRSGARATRARSRRPGPRTGSARGRRSSRGRRRRPPASQRPSGEHAGAPRRAGERRATSRGSADAVVASRRAGRRPRRDTSQIDVRGRRSASSRGSATKAIARPSGRQRDPGHAAGDVGQRGAAARRRAASTTWSWLRRSR